MKHWDNQDSSESGSAMPAELLSTVRNYVAETLQLFGFQAVGQSSDTALSTASATEEPKNVLLEFRAAMRKLGLDAAKSGKDVSSKDVLQLCDSLRDDVLPTVFPYVLNADLATTQARFST